jgi:hypothetical protein
VILIEIPSRLIRRSLFRAAPTAPRETSRSGIRPPRRHCYANVT